MQTPARYQMHRGFATSPLENALRLGVLLLALAVTLAWPSRTSASTPAGAAQKPLMQQQGVTRQLYLLPADNSPVQLQTHLVGMNTTYHNDGSVSVFVNADYRLKNGSEETLLLPLLVYSGIGSALPQAVTLTANGEALPLVATTGGDSSSQIEIAADSEVTIRLSYRVTVARSPIVTIRYAPSVLRKWLGPTSTRIDVTVPDAIARESWTEISPDSWSYAASELGFTAVKWLYDSLVPDEEFVVQFVEPILWADLQAAEAMSATGGPAAAYLARGDLYRSLAESESADGAVRERFAAQAIAAYVDGIQRGAGATPADLAQMHIGLATLYRNRAAQPDRETASHALLMVEEATAALANLQADDARRAELEQWLADGLRTLFADARARGDWQRINQVVDRMESLPPGVVDAALIEEGRQIVLVQQALQLMRRGEQDAAANLLGPELTAQASAAPLALLPLFAEWHITVTAYPDTVSVDIETLPTPGREGEAQQALNNLAQAWQSELAHTPASDGNMAVSGVDGGTSSRSLHVSVEAPASLLRDAWATYVPSSGDFALLRTTLRQLAPELHENTRFFQHEMARRQPMDLREAGQQWSAVEADINRQAAQIRAQAEDGDAKDQLLAELQAANYGKAAEAWRDLARDSWLRFQFQDGDETSEASRVWYATTASSPVVFNAQTQSVDMGLAAGFLVAALAIVVVISGVLWWLI